MYGYCDIHKNVLYILLYYKNVFIIFVLLLYSLKIRKNLRYWHVGPLKSVGHWHFWYPIQLPPFKQGGSHTGLQSGTVDHSTFPGIQEPFLQNTFVTLDESGNWYPSIQLIVHALYWRTFLKLVSNYTRKQLKFLSIILTLNCISFLNSLVCWDNRGSTYERLNFDTLGHRNFSDNCTCWVSHKYLHFHNMDYKQLSKYTTHLILFSYKQYSNHMKSNS